jgi:type II secretory pathway pseudopilin PulG
MKKHMKHNTETTNRMEQGFTIVETVVTLIVVTAFITLFAQGYLLLSSQRAIVVQQSKADAKAQANLRLVSKIPDFINSPTACPAGGWNLTDTGIFSNPIPAASINASSEQLTMYCVDTSNVGGPKRIVSKVIVNASRTIVYAKILNS